MLSQVHWDTFQSIAFIPQDTFGRTPISWAKANRINLGLEDYCLPDKVLTRQEVRKLCHDKNIPVLFAYVCAMAWGLQGSGPGGSRTVERSWGAKSTIEDLLIEIRTSSLTRAQGYKLFERNPVPGLGRTSVKSLYACCPISTKSLLNYSTYIFITILQLYYFGLGVMR